MGRKKGTRAQQKQLGRGDFLAEATATAKGSDKAKSAAQQLRGCRTNAKGRKRTSCEKGRLRAKGAASVPITLRGKALRTAAGYIVTRNPRWGSACEGWRRKKERGSHGTEIHEFELFVV